MSHLLDVSFLVAIGWSTHPEHAAATRAWAVMNQCATCSAVQMGFLRVSMSPAFKSTFADALQTLNGILSRPGHRFLADATTAPDLPVVTSGNDITDAHFVTLAKHHGLKLATLDLAMCGKPWAAGVAEFFGTNATAQT